MFSAVKFSLNEVFIHLTITIITQIQTTKERDEFFFQILGDAEHTM